MCVDLIPPVYGCWQFQAQQCSCCLHHDSLSKNYQYTLAQKTIIEFVIPQSFDIFFVLEVFFLLKSSFTWFVLWHFGAIESMATQPLDISDSQALCQDEIFKSTCMTLYDICFCTSWCSIQLVQQCTAVMPFYSQSYMSQQVDSGNERQVFSALKGEIQNNRSKWGERIQTTGPEPVYHLSNTFS